MTDGYDVVNGDGRDIEGEATSPPDRQAAPKKFGWYDADKNESGPLGGDGVNVISGRNKSIAREPAYHNPMPTWGEPGSTLGTGENKSLEEVEYDFFHEYLELLPSGTPEQDDGPSHPWVDEGTASSQSWQSSESGSVVSWYSQESASYTVLDWLRKHNPSPAGHTIQEATAEASGGEAVGASVDARPDDPPDYTTAKSMNPTPLPWLAVMRHSGPYVQPFTCRCDGTPTMTATEPLLPPTHSGTVGWCVHTAVHSNQVSGAIWFQILLSFIVYLLRKKGLPLLRGLGCHTIGCTAGILGHDRTG